MGTVTDMTGRRGAKRSGAQGPRTVTCTQCGERHPVVRLAGGASRCVTAFNDGNHWFCRNRGCRAAWAAARAGDS